MFSDHMLSNTDIPDDLKNTKTCYQVNEAENLELLHEWVSNWNDVTDFEFIPVISSHDMSEK